MKRLVLICVAWVLVGESAFCNELNNLSLIIRVVDEGSQAVPNSEVEMSFGGKTGIGRKDFVGITDTNGMLKVKFETYGSISVSARKEGYYGWGAEYHFYISTEMRISDEIDQSFRK